MSAPRGVRCSSARALLSNCSMPPGHGGVKSTVLDTEHCSRQGGRVPAPHAGHSARARARAELTLEIKRVARRQLTEVGAAALSIRAVTRELGMVSSAIYRYFPSRDDLLTALIVDTYDEVGEAAEQAAASTRGGVEKRFGAVATAIRAWAVANPQDYALVYGSPVPGYAAPEDTIAPAARVALAALQIVADGVA